MRSPEWPVGPTFYSQQHSLPWLPQGIAPAVSYSGWGMSHPTQVWQNAGSCHPGAGQSGDDAYLAELLADRNTPTEARPYLQRGEWPPTPGSRAYSYDVRPQFVDRMDEQYYLDWWYAHFTSDAPRYTLPPLPDQTGPGRYDTPPATTPPTRPPRDWPDQTPATPPDEPTTTITTTGTPTETTRTPWGWIIGGSAVLLLVGGGAAYLVTRPKKRKDGGRRSGRRRRRRR